MQACGLAGKAGVALSTLGPGATNMTTSAAYAQLGGFPALLITGTACNISLSTCMHVWARIRAAKHALEYAIVAAALCCTLWLRCPSS